MAHIFIGRKRMMYLIALLLSALMLVCPAAWAQQIEQITTQPPIKDSPADVLQISASETAPSQTDYSGTILSETDFFESNSQENTSRTDPSENHENVSPAETDMPQVTSTPQIAETSQPTATIMPDPTPTYTPEVTAVPEPQVHFSRDFSSRYAEYGASVTLSYTVRNDGVLPITNIVVRDGAVGKVGSISKLEPGERKTVSAKVKVTKTCTSSPSISYEYDAKSYSKRCSEKSIYLAEVDVEIEVEADKTNVAPGEYVTLRLRICNEGNVNLYGLRVSEPMLGEISGSISSLPPNEECVITRTVQMKSAATFCFTVSGSSDTGGTFSVQAEPMDILVTPVASQIALELLVQADRTELEAPGEVCFSLQLNNLCTTELRGVSVSEQTRGEIRSLAFVPTGKMPFITQIYEVSESGTYIFKAQMRDSVGDEVTVYSVPIHISVHTDQPQQTQAPTQTSDKSERDTIEVPDGPPYRMSEEVATFERLIIWTVFLLIGVLSLWYMISQVRRLMRRLARRRRRQRSRNSGREKRREKTRDKRRTAKKKAAHEKAADRM